MADIDPNEAPIRWPYRADRPQRYVGNYGAYRRIGGPVNLEAFVQGFVAGGTNQSDMARFYFFCLAFDQIVKEDLEGDLAELGVYKGNTATLLAEIARARGATAYLLDTFTGFNKKDIKGVDAAAREAAFSDTSLEAVRALVGEENVRYIPGYFPETASQIPDDARFCLVHIDCDLYAPIYSALEYFYPRMVPGGYLIVHDYTSLHWNGAERAVDEFFLDKPEPVIPLPDGAGSVVIRKFRQPQSGINWLVQKQAKLLRDEWVPAGNGAMRDLLGAGWSGPEPWGVWGIGELHELHLVLPANATGEFELQADVHVSLVGSRTSQEVTVLLDGRERAKWEFNSGHNRGIRSVWLPVPAADSRRDGLRAMKVVFRPASVATPADLDPTLTETRPLGLALHRIRLIHDRSSDAPAMAAGTL
jgi:hypothetical protein